MRPKIRSLLMMAAMMESANDHNINENHTQIPKQTTPSYKRKLCKSCDSFNKSRNYCGVKNYIMPKSKACEEWTKRKTNY